MKKLTSFVALLSFFGAVGTLWGQNTSYSPPDYYQPPFSDNFATGTVEFGGFELGRHVTISLTGLGSNVVPVGTCTFLSGQGQLPPGMQIVTYSFIYPDQPGGLVECRLAGTPTETGSFTFRYTFRVCFPSRPDLSCDDVVTGNYQNHLTVLSRYAQGGSAPWAGNTYDDYSDTACKTATNLVAHPPKILPSNWQQTVALSKHCHISQGGCTVTALAMMLEAVGVSPRPPLVLTPASINSFEQGGGFSAGPPAAYTGFGHDLNLDSNSVPRAVKGLMGATGKFSWKSGGGSTVDDLEKALSNGFPVLVHVPHLNNSGCGIPENDDFGHYVVVTNEQLDDNSTDLNSQGDGVRFIIHNPGCTLGNSPAVNDLRAFRGSDGNLRFDIRGYVKDPADVSRFSVGATPNVAVSIYNSLGQQLSLDPDTGTSLHEIPNTFIHQDTQADPDTGEIVTATNYLAMEQPSDDSYRVEVTSKQGGPFAITISGVSIDGEEQPSQMIRDVIAPGAMKQYTVAYSPVSSAPAPVTGLPLVGDVNGDGKVDCSDMAIVRSAFGKIAGADGFDAHADLNADGIVDINDLTIVARRLTPGQTCQ